MISGQFRPKFNAGKWRFGVCRQVEHLQFLQTALGLQAKAGRQNAGPPSTLTQGESN